MNKSIGLFDSGIGGISILNSLVTKLPDENFIYLSDNKNCPYGDKSQEEITILSIKNSKKLIELNCKIIIVACNTATTNCIEFLRKKISIPIIGVEPGVKPALLNTKSKNIGVLATKNTLTSELFNKTANNNLKNNIKIHEQIGYELVNEIEKGVSNNKPLKQYLKKYLKPMLENNIDYLVLGCTHYHFLINEIRELINKNITIVDTISPITNHVVNILNRLKIETKNISKGKVYVFYNGNPISKEFIKKNYKVNYLDF
jgi:glutamate racemase